MSETHKLESAIWHEIANDENPFLAEQCYCHGYNVYDDLLPNASWPEYLYLLISGRQPTKETSQLLEKLAIIMANPGIRDLSVRSAMNAGVGKAPSASVLIAALSAGSGQLGGGREIYLAMKLWMKNLDKKSFDLLLASPAEKDIWPQLEHTPGFDPNSESASKIVASCLNYLVNQFNGKYLSWLKKCEPQLVAIVNAPLSLSGIIAAAFCDLELTPQQGEYLYLILRLPGAAAHAMEQEKLGWKKFPFFADTVSTTQENAGLPLPDIEHLIEGYLDES